jgi:hypothetical protein
MPMRLILWSPARDSSSNPEMARTPLTDPGSGLVQDDPDG